jgi:phosphate:Na+ symporter
MQTFQSLLELFGGLAIFIYGVHFLSEGLEKVAGTQLLAIMDRSLDHVLKQGLFGMTATALMQSSGLLMVTMIGLINANMLNLQQAIGIMLGQEIGTTITGQLVSFRIGSFNLLFLIAGFFMMNFSTKPKLRMIGQPLFGFGMVFMGMSLMGNAGKTISQMPFFQQAMLLLSKQVLLGVLVGAVFTAAIQSSTAMTGLVIAMGRSDSITLPVAIAIILGANIGSCIMGWVAAAQSGTGAKRASYSQITINIAGVLLFLPFIMPFTGLVASTSRDLPRQIANAHTIFNLTVSMLMLPFVKTLAGFIEKIIPDKEEEKEKKRTRFIDPRLLSMPVMAVQMAKEEVLRVGWMAHEMVKRSSEAMVETDNERIKWVLKHEKRVDEIYHNMEAFLASIPSEKLAPNDVKMLENLKHLLTDIERVGDHANNLAEFAEQIGSKKHGLSKYGRKEVKNLSERVLNTYGLALKALKTDNRKFIDQVVVYEDEIDKMEKAYKKNHINRLKKKICNPELDTIYVETLRNLERIGDHAYNIALSLTY